MENILVNEEGKRNRKKAQSGKGKIKIVQCCRTKVYIIVKKRWSICHDAGQKLEDEDMPIECNI